MGVPPSINVQCNALSIKVSEFEEGPIVLTYSPTGRLPAVFWKSAIAQRPRFKKYILGDFVRNIRLVYK